MPYYRLGLAHRYSANAWWRPLIEFVALAVLATVLSVVIFILLGFAAELAGVDVAENSADPLMPLIEVLAIAAMLPAPFVAARIAGRNPRALISRALRWRWGVFARALGVVGAVYGVQVLIDVLTAFPEPIFNPFRAKLLLALLIAVPLQSAAEEFVFRGALPQILGQWRWPAWLAYLVPGALFVASHVYNWVGLVDIAIFALCTSLLAWRTGGLEAPIVLHAVGNLMVFGYGALALSDPTETEILPADTIMSSLVAVATTALMLWALRDVSPEREKVSTGQQKTLVQVGSTA
ncbi:CPBP family intramembrane glutamic endopeptidase [Corynebacterium mucifaciens]|uniref:CPBP family intramembrane metalloprotease n=1 Tax=Corynebacterium mucifaciens TaxID=57171 RepID=A0A7X6LSJ4_9CORY|nr:type II CAAX endopeptidase family protein [Corynebacterium mucifaciens]NKY69037.1 CPBP family intramembrane metalloprotease [Corynebacterium mucifaciens]